MVCSRCWLAGSPLTRLRGLIGVTALREDEGLMLRPAFAVHTALMRFPIDAVFLGPDGRIVGIREALVPWRGAACRRARSVLELAAGQAERMDLALGDRLLTTDGRG